MGEAAGAAGNGIGQVGSIAADFENAARRVMDVVHAVPDSIRLDQSKAGQPKDCE